MNPEPSLFAERQAWLASPLGGYFADWERSRLDALLVDVFGYNALQIGMEGDDLLRANRMPLHVRALRDGASPPESGEAVAVGEAALPFAGASLDLVVLAHALEFSASPHQVLREVERVLVPEGSVVICGFNPYSLWSWRRRVCGGGQWPWRGQYLSAPRVRDWLNLLGCEVLSTQFGCYVPGVSSPEWLARWRWLDRVGCRWWPPCGAVWIVHGIKRVAGARLIQPNWREKRARASNLSPVAHKVAGRGEKPEQPCKP